MLRISIATYLTFGAYAVNCAGWCCTEPSSCLIDNSTDDINCTCTFQNFNGCDCYDQTHCYSNFTGCERFNYSCASGWFSKYCSMCGGHGLTYDAYDGCTCQNQWEIPTCVVCPVAFGGDDCNMCADQYNQSTYPACNSCAEGYFVDITKSQDPRPTCLSYADCDADWCDGGSASTHTKNASIQNSTCVCHCEDGWYGELKWDSKPCSYCYGHGASFNESNSECPTCEPHFDPGYNCMLCKLGYNGDNCTECFVGWKGYPDCKLPVFNWFDWKICAGVFGGMCCLIGAYMLCNHNRYKKDIGNRKPLLVGVNGGDLQSTEQIREVPGGEAT